MTLEQISYYINAAAFAIVAAMWLVLIWALIARRKHGSAPHASHERRSWIGFALQILSFPVIGVGSVFRTPMFSPVFAGQYAFNIILQAIAVILIVASVAMEIAAFNELGKQWSLEARVLEGHKLVTTGIYSFVRHPIYTALLARLIATGLTFSHWITICIAVVVYLIGTRIRTVSEDRLLSRAFGKQFDEWKARVPSLLPFIGF